MQNDKTIDKCSNCKEDIIHNPTCQFRLNIGFLVFMNALKQFNLAS